MREPPLKTLLYWCETCNVPLIGRTCGCGSEGKAIPLLRPYDVRPALEADHALIRELLHTRFGVQQLPRVILLNKTGGLDRTEQVLMNGVRLGQLTFQPFTRTYRMDLSLEALPFLLPQIREGIVTLRSAIGRSRIGGKKVAVQTSLDNGPVVVRYGELWGVGTLQEGQVRIRKIGPVIPREVPDPDWETVIGRNRHHLRNLERHALRFIRRHRSDRNRINVAFSGGKDSTAVLELARRAGITEAYFVDTGLEYPETREFVRRCGIPTWLNGGDFWKELDRRGPPRKDDRWCCETLKLAPVQEWLASTGECVTIQGTRWYESFTRSALSGTATNPATPFQRNIFPIRNWRALEVFLYLWWRECAINPLYERGLERIGCWTCPAMLESEADTTRQLHPELYDRWWRYLHEWAGRRRLPPEFVDCGLWRWKNIPPKMVEEATRRQLPPSWKNLH